MTKADYAIITAGAACMFALFAPIFGSPKEVYAIYDDPALQVGGSVAEVQKREAFFTANRFAVEYRLEVNEINIYKKASFIPWTSYPFLLLKLKNQRIVGKGFRIMEGWYTLCNAPADVGEIEPTRPAPDGRACLGG